MFVINLEINLALAGFTFGVPLYNTCHFVTATIVYHATEFNTIFRFRKYLLLKTQMATLEQRGAAWV
jgi:hypothetical protein